MTFKRAKIRGIPDQLVNGDGTYMASRIDYLLQTVVTKAFIEEELDAVRGLLQAVVQSDFIDPYIPVSAVQSEMVENMDLEQYYGFVFDLKDDEEEKA